MRAAVASPSPAQIGRMDEVDRWISELVTDPLNRRILRARTFINPRTQKPVISWPALAKMTSMSHQAVQWRFRYAIEKLTAALQTLQRGVL